MKPAVEENWRIDAREAVGRQTELAKAVRVRRCWVRMPQQRSPTHLPHRATTTSRLSV